MKTLRAWILRWLRKPSNSLMLMSAFILSLHHHWTQLTFGAFSLAAGSILARKVGI
ncbi:hypothetical protein ACYOEI_10905 [Singulisphaera rosea]